MSVAAGQLTSLSAEADRLAAVIRLMGDCVDRLGNGTPQSQDDLADLLYLVEIETRKLANGLGRLVQESGATQ